MTLEERAKGVKCGSHQVLVTHQTKVGPDGAAGSIVLLLTWVFYSSQIIFFGAEFTHALAAEHGISMDAKRVREDNALV